MTETQALLSDYVKNGSEAAFRELVNRYLGLVHSTAVRVVDGDTHLAEDVAQTVFVDLARMARTLSGEVTLGGWLHRHTCFVAANSLRTERRRQKRERQALEMNAQQDHSQANLSQVAPILDEAINQLGSQDRTAILLRFFEHRDLRAIGQVLGSNEDAAQKRVARALDKLRSMLAHRGVTFSAAALGTALASEAVAAAPVGLAASITGTALTGAAVGGGAFTLLKILTMTKLKIGFLSIIAASAVAVPLVTQHQAQVQLRAENAALRQQVEQLAQLEEQNSSLSNQLAQAKREQLSNKALSELVKLRGQVAALRDSKNELERLKADKASQAALANRQQQVVATTVQDESLVSACINNLRQIEGAKQQWALENKQTEDAIPTAESIAIYTGRTRQLPVCPSGGTYTLGTMKELPQCSIAGHKLPE